MRRLILALFTVTLLPAQVVPGHYIVELSEEPVAAGVATVGRNRRAAFIRDRQAVIRSQQRFVGRLLERYRTDVLDSVETVANALLVRMPDRLAARLSSLPGIRRVRPVYEIKASLDHAVPLHKAPQAWTRIGGDDLAGAGVKIGVIDTGIDDTHPGFVDPSLPAPEGFPRANRIPDLEFTSNKVIVARSYLSLFGTETNLSARDSDGHGTAVAMAAAGVIRETENGFISGVAQKAYLGSYNVFRRDGTSRQDIVLKAFDDAVADGMDVINLSLGSPFALRPNDDIFVSIIERAVALGVLVVVSAGNSGPEPFTIADIATAPAAISVGASWNDRILSGSVTLEGGERYQVVPGSGPNSEDPVTAPLFDVSQVDPSGLACSSLPPGSLLARIAFILRGTCFFEDKLNNAEEAGAVAALVYTHADEPDAITMAVGSARLPASMVSHADGLQIRELLSASEDLAATIDFRENPFPVDPNRLGTFSSRGPSTDFSLKPDLLATGVALNTATLGAGYEVVQGTSFSAPIVAGAAALLKAARPSYSGHHYRSLLINTATPLVLDSGEFAPLQHAGSGVLNVEGALTSMVTAYPTSLSFGFSAGNLSRNLLVSNLGTAAEAFAISVQPFRGGPPPSVSESTFLIPPLSTHTVTLGFAGQGLEPGEYQGLVRIQGSGPATDIHVPYWYAAPSEVPAYLKILDQVEDGTPGTLIRGAISVRTTDASGLPLSNLRPTVTTISGGGSVVNVYSTDSINPGVFDVNVRLGPEPGDNVFRVEVDGLSEEVTIRGLRP